jgi:hypothetical protein
MLAKAFAEYEKFEPVNIPDVASGDFSVPLAGIYLLPGFVPLSSCIAQAWTQSFTPPPPCLVVLIMTPP